MFTNELKREVAALEVLKRRADEEHRELRNALAQSVSQIRACLQAPLPAGNTPRQS